MQASDANYEEVPIESFGKAMLRGMGWQEGKGIGKNGEVVNPVNAVLRPKGMGLGADRSVVEQLKAQKSGKSGKQEKLEMKAGAYCIITSGKHENYYGQVCDKHKHNDNYFVFTSLNRGGSLENDLQFKCTRKDMTDG